MKYIVDNDEYGCTREQAVDLGEHLRTEWKFLASCGTSTAPTTFTTPTTSATSKTLPRIILTTPTTPTTPPITKTPTTPTAHTNPSRYLR